jgi:hypothetical protein
MPANSDIATWLILHDVSRRRPYDRRSGGFRSDYADTAGALTRVSAANRSHNLTLHSIVKYQRAGVIEVQRPPRLFDPRDNPLGVWYMKRNYQYPINGRTCMP